MPAVAAAHDHDEMDESNDDAIELLGRVRKGDIDALRTLYKACSVVHPYVLKLCGDPSLAKEIFFDTVTEIWKGSAVFRGDSKFSTWAIAIARNLTFSALRKRQREEPLTGQQAEADVDADLEEHPASVDVGCMLADPFHAVARQQHRDGVLGCIQKLSPKLGECLLLVYYADMSQTEVAAMLGLNINTVKTRVRDAHLKVKNCLTLLTRGGRHD